VAGYQTEYSGMKSALFYLGKPYIKSSARPCWWRCSI